ncbi:MAG: metallophosphoesterase, partial [Prevotellaceae bacterium]|nr:metallophosphoesterase [Prevotellaceae bacterium]
MKFMAFFFLILLIYIGINGWLFHALLQTTRQWHVAGKIVISMVYWLLAISFFLMQVWRDKLPVETGHWLYWISNGWLAFFFYLALLYGIAMLLKLVGLRIPHAFVWCTGATALLLICGYIHFDRPMVRRIKLDLPHSAPMRIVAVSDVHLGYGITRGRLQRYVDLINSQHPDLILIAGDLIDMSVAPLWKERMQDELNRLQAPMGIYMVPGNHEYISGIRQSTAFIEQTRITLLRDSVVRLPNGIQLAGRDDR